MESSWEVDLQGGLYRKFPREAVSQLEDSKMMRAGSGKEREESLGKQPPVDWFSSHKVCPVPCTER